MESRPMSNERITENIVRGLLREKGYYDSSNIVVEEQSSSNPRIDNLLKNASKSGGGKGYPEFIISFKDAPDNLIIIECKAGITRHESKNRKQYKDYAVDGALLYAAYLQKSFNVTAIAVSGENDRELKISSFLWLKDNFTYKDIEDKILLKPSEIKKVIIKESKPLDEQKLIEKAKSYNTFLHQHSIPEKERCTLISALLTALQDDAFLNSFQHHGTNKALIDAMLSACENVLIKSGLNNDKIEIIILEYSKPRNIGVFRKDTHVDKTTKTKVRNTILRDFIARIKEEILPYIKNSEFDVLGKFYTQFIRYAGSDKKTGLVLTPSHITDLFCEIAELNANDVVFDPCCGTAGFLVSAMNYMIKQVEHNSDKQKEIRSNQLLGIEERADMFAHACSNMMMRGDGKSHIIFGDCFEEDNKNTVKQEKATKGFLNPPYQDRNLVEQLEFIESTLECLVKDGICVAICQMSTVVSDKKSVVEVRERLLKKHTLEAVFSMPNDLFHPMGVVTCILVFKAHNPHLENKKTFFGYFKDDGLIKIKYKGRIDLNNQWQDIKQKWLLAYRNKEIIAGLSVMQEIKAKDEWCAEAYMETDYSTLTENDFIRTAKEYVAFQFLNGGE